MKLDDLAGLIRITLGAVDANLEIREIAGSRLVEAYHELGNIDALIDIATKDSGHLPLVKEKAIDCLIERYTEKVMASELRDLSEGAGKYSDVTITLKAQEKAWEKAKLCILMAVTGQDAETLKEKHRDFIKNAPPKKPLKSVPPRLTPLPKKTKA